MGGREGLIDTAVKTSETGYIQRKLIKAMEDLKVYHNLSVRNANGNIVQFLYGEDGMDYGKIESQRLSHFDSDIHRLRKEHLFTKTTDYNLFMTEKAVKVMKKDKKYKDINNAFFQQIRKDVDIVRTFIFKGYRDNNISFPININRIVDNMKKKCDISLSSRSDMTPQYIITQLNVLIDSLKASNSVKGTDLFGILLRSYLSPKLVIEHHRLNKFTFDLIIAQIKLQYYDSLVQPGEMVGPIAAQSIGEPATQMTLNTFHFAGVSEKSNVTRGVPRLKELLHISKNPKVPSLNIYLNEENRFSKDKSLSILNDIGVTSLKDITKSMRIFHDPNDYESNVEEDRDLLEVYKAFQTIDPCLRTDDEGSDWVIRFEFDKQTMMEKDITMADVYSKIYQKYSNCVNCIYSDDNSSKLVFRIRLMKTKKKDAAKKEQETIQDLNNIKALSKNIRESVLIKGIDGIKSVSMYKNQSNYVFENDSYVMKEEWVLDTHGVNLLEVLRYPGVDATRTISNDIYEVYNTFGIEAAKQVLLKEIREVIDSGGSYVNFRHLELLVDTMTYRGYLMSIDRFGINRGNIGPLAKCSFEEATDQLFNASIFGEVDKLNGVSSNVMMGQIPPCGTGMSDVLLDETKLYDIDGEEEEEVTDLEQIGDLDYCDNFVQMDFAIENEENEIEFEKTDMSDMNVVIKSNSQNRDVTQYNYGDTSEYIPTSPQYPPVDYSEGNGPKTPPLPEKDI
jgi:DNA-directed RNA polymerase II subunit RPB1